jgi:hypothetical protein
MEAPMNRSSLTLLVAAYTITGCGKTTYESSNDQPASKQIQAEGFLLASGSQTTASNNIIQVSTIPSMAGAVSSLIWNGKDFINRYDHGRELQYALHLNHDGECYNPTEAGGRNDGGEHSPSSSQLLALHVSGNIMETMSRMAFWMDPGEMNGSGCEGRMAVNKTKVSDYVLAKRVTVGSHGIDHIVRFQATIKAPEDIRQFQIEAPTGYLNGEFTRFYSVDPIDGSIGTLPPQFGEYTDTGIIISTADGSHAMGAWAPPLAGYSVSYASGYFASPEPQAATAKWSAVYRKAGVPAGDYGFDTFVAVGSLENVRVALRQLYARYSAPAQVTEAFRRYLGREASPSDIAAWVELVKDGGKPVDFISNAVKNSDEAVMARRNAIIRAFRTYLKRVPAESDIAAWDMLGIFQDSCRIELRCNVATRHGLSFQAV